MALIEGDDDPLIGSVLADRYRIEELIGNGGLGVVYRARHVSMSQRRFAIKIPFGELALDAEVVGRFSREAELAGRLAHPNLVAVVDVGETRAGLPYMAMDYADGVSLADVIDDEGPQPRERIIGIAKQIAEGLSHAHAAGVVHRDLKPDNIILEGAGVADRVRIVDFGIALLIAADAGEAGRRLTGEGRMVGSPAYTAPEQATGGPIDARTDLFALGVILYELLAGATPFEGSPLDVIRANVSLDPPAIAERVPGLAVDAGLEALAMRLMSKRGADRLPGARAVLDELRALGCSSRGEVVEVVEPEGEVAPPVSAASSLAPPAIGRARGRVAAIVAVAALAAVALLLWASRPSSRIDPPPPAVARATLPPVAAPVVAPPAPMPIAALVLPSREAAPSVPSKPAPAAKPRPARRAEVVAAPAPTAPPPVEAAPVPVPAPAPRTLTALYRDVGAALNDLLRIRGDAPAAPLRDRYQQLAYLAALRNPALRSEVTRELERLARDIAAAR